jgi:hypothetical protein
MPAAQRLEERAAWVQALEGQLAKNEANSAKPLFSD